jgi:uncharacterized SAM-binding protein YcdF (DUF218 family)
MTSSFFPSFLFRSRRSLVLLASAILLAGAAFLSLGRFITRLSPLERADAIYVLGGSRTSRTIEAARLYRDGYAPRVLLSPGGRDLAELELERQGIHVPTDAEIGRDLLLRLGVPPDAILILPQLVDNTAQEADAIASLAETGHWAALIVITDRSSTRRAGYAFRRVFGDRLKVLVTCNRQDPFDPNRWWAERWSFRATFYEAPKLLAYWMGLKG